MPRLLEAKKDVVSCEKLRGFANETRSAEEEKKETSISKVAASEMEEAQTDIVTAISGL